MTRICKLEASNYNDKEILEKMKKECNEYNSVSTVNENGYKYTKHVIKLKNSKRKDYFIIQTRRYKPRDNKLDTVIINQIKEDYKNNLSIKSISEKYNLSTYKIKKYI